MAKWFRTCGLIKKQISVILVFQCTALQVTAILYIQWEHSASGERLEHKISGLEFIIHKSDQITIVMQDKKIVRSFLIIILKELIMDGKKHHMCVTAF